MSSQESGYGMNPPPVKPNLTSTSWMPKALIFMGLALIAAVVYGIAVTGQKNTLNAELTSVSSQLASTQTELSSAKQSLASTKQTLASTETELGNTKQTLASTQTELGNTKQTLASTQTELGTTKQTLASTQTELGTTKQTLASTQTLLASTNQTLVSTQAELASTKQTLTSTQGELAATKTQLQTVTAEKDLMSLQYANLRDFIHARFGLTTIDRQRYITPYHPVVNSTVVVNWGVPVDDSNKLWQVYDSMLKWVVSNIRYSYDSYTPLMPSAVSGSITWVSEFWRMPVETLVDQTGDCEDMALLLASMMLNYNQNKYAVWIIEIDSSVPGVPGHAAVALPVAGGRLSILDPAGLYYTGMYQYNQLDSDVAASALNNWLSHWSQQIPGAYVSRIFSQSEDRQFSSNAEFLNWLSQR